MKKYLLLFLVLVHIRAFALENFTALEIPKTEFKAMDDAGDAFYYVTPGVELNNYKSVLIKPLAFLQRTGTAWSLFEMGEQSKLSRYYTKTLEAELAKRKLTIATVPGPDVLTFRAAFTGLDYVSTDLQLSDFLPVKAIFNAVRYATGNKPELLKVSLVTQLEDSQSGNLIAATINARKADSAKSGPVTEESLKKFVDIWTVKIADKMAKALADSE